MYIYMVPPPKDSPFLYDMEIFQINLGIQDYEIEKD